MSHPLELTERICVEKVRKADSVVIEVGELRVRVRGGQVSHDIALALQTHFGNTHKKALKDYARTL